MPRCLNTIVYIAFICYVAASPLDPRVLKSRSSVFLSVQKSQNKTGPQALEYLYEKYNSRIQQPVRPPADVVRAVSGNDGTVTSIPGPYDVEYLSPIKIGSQTFDLAIDTGSADLWVFSSSLDDRITKLHTVYDPKRSSSAKQLQGYDWKISYGDGSGALGDVYTDTVSVGNTQAKSQTIEAAKQISASFAKDADSDGILGLAFDSINQVKPTKQKTFFSNVKSTLQSPLFTADLRKGKPGSYDFGFIDSTKYSGAIEYIPVNSSLGFWQFTAAGYKVGNGAYTDAPMDAIMDTGTTLLLLHPPVVSAYYSQISGASYDPAQGGYTFACGTKLPDLTIFVGSHQAVIPGDYLIYAPLDENNKSCFGALQMNTGMPFAVFGDVFIKTQFVVFDTNGPRLGIASKRL